MLNRELEVTLNLAFKEARSKRHEFMTVEHLLLALLITKLPPPFYVRAAPTLTSSSMTCRSLSTPPRH